MHVDHGADEASESEERQQDGGSIEPQDPGDGVTGGHADGGEQREHSCDECSDDPTVPADRLDPPGWVRTHHHLLPPHLMDVVGPRPDARPLNTVDDVAPPAQLGELLWSGGMPDEVVTLADGVGVMHPVVAEDPALSL